MPSRHAFQALGAQRPLLILQLFNSTIPTTFSVLQRTCDVFRSVHQTQHLHFALLPVKLCGKGRRMRFAWLLFRR